MVKKESAIIYVDRNKILFYGQEAKSVLELNIPQDVISNLEVVDSDKLSDLIDNFCNSQGISGKEFDATLIFSQNISFFKELEEKNTKLIYEETQKFLDTVPFEDTLSNSFRIGKLTRVVAVNRNIYDNLRPFFEKNKIHIALVLSMAVIAKVNPELEKRLDLSFIEGKAASYRQYSLIDLSEIGLEGEQVNSIGIKKKDVRLYVLLGIFALLFLILSVLVYTTFFNTPPAKKRVSFPRITITPTPNLENNTGSTSADLSSESSELKNKNLPQ